MKGHTASEEQLASARKSHCGAELAFTCSVAAHCMSTGVCAPTLPAALSTVDCGLLIVASSLTFQFQSLFE